MKFPLKVPRLLPMTMLAMACLLGVKSVTLVRVAFPVVTSGAAQAAEPAPASAAPPGAKPAVAADAQVPAKATPPPPEPPVSETERTLLLDLRKRRGELDAREAALATREAVLAAAQTRLSARVDELGSLQKRLESLETARRDRDEANWRGLVKLYETMKPRDAAAIFNDLDPAVLLPVLDRMKESKAAAIFAAMLPDRARTATSALAQMRAKANTVPPAGDVAPAAKAAAGG